MRHASRRWPTGRDHGVQGGGAARPGQRRER
jgi:hypothetical protein